MLYCISQIVFLFEKNSCCLFYFGDECFQAIDCTGTDDWTRNPTGKLHKIKKNFNKTDSSWEKHSKRIQNAKQQVKCVYDNLPSSSLLTCCLLEGWTTSLNKWNLWKSWCSLPPFSVYPHDRLERASWDAFWSTYICYFPSTVGVGGTYSKADQRLSTSRDLSAAIYKRTPISPPCHRMTYSWRRWSISPACPCFCSSIQTTQRWPLSGIKQTQTVNSGLNNKCTKQVPV